MNEMRTLVGEMQRQEREMLARRSAESQHSARVAIINDLVGSLLGIGLVGLAFLLFGRELTHRRRADDATRLLAAIVECSDDAIVSKTLGGLIVSWNAGAQRIYGYSAEEVIGQPVTLLCPSDRIDEVHRNLDRVRRGTPIDHFETFRVRKDGRRIDVSLSISPIKDGQGRVIGASAIARDITDRMRMQREVLEIASREQQRIGQDLHDGTGQELTGLAMMAQRLAGELSKRSLPEGATATRIVDGLEQALRNVRALSRGLLPVEVDSEGLTMALTNLASRTCELHDVFCTFKCDSPVCTLDNQTATHLYRLSQEAVTNAVKHGHADNIAISLATEGDLVVLKIADNGIGFIESQEEMTGTGLRIMRYRAELIRATLSFGKVSTHGTVVTCTLPQSRDPGVSSVPEFQGVALADAHAS
jgi:PAS domain S-box-containing protein